LDELNDRALYCSSTQGFPVVRFFSSSDNLFSSFGTFKRHIRTRLQEVSMSESTPQNWRTMFEAAMSEGESGELEPMIDDTEVAIQERLREVVDNFSASEESELYAALGVLRRVRAQLLRAA
jgi:hypothetical protein